MVSFLLHARNTLLRNDRLYYTIEGVFLWECVRKGLDCPPPTPSSKDMFSVVWKTGLMVLDSKVVLVLYPMENLKKFKPSSIIIL